MEIAVEKSLGSRSIVFKSKKSFMSSINKKILTLCVVHNNARILLGMKKRGFGAGRWNGFGGKVEPGETIEEAAARELEEEAGLRAKEISRRGTVTFIYNDDQTSMEVHIFSVTLFEGVPGETEEMLPQWFARDDIPLDKMWPDDKYWLPLFLAGKNFKGEFIFSDKNTIINYSIKTE